MLDQFRDAVLEHRFSGILMPDFRISSHGRLSTYYAPFEHINRQARVVLVGITPGQSQAVVALQVLGAHLARGASDEDSLRAAKETASFSGAMRTSLVDMLDSVGLQRALGLDTCKELFGASSGLVHYTSALRYPVLSGESNYSGAPAITQTPYLLGMVDQWLAEEARALPDAVWIPLGREPAAALRHLASTGVLDGDRVLEGLPHPSGANGERIAYFLRRKAREKLSSKTNAAAMDEAREQLLRKVAALG